MNRFSRIRHHVDMKDVRRKHLEEAAAKKIQEEKIKEERKLHKEVYNKWKSDWRDELKEKIILTDTLENNSKEWSQELDDMWKSDWKDKLEEGMSTSDTFSYSVTGRGDVDLTTTGTGYTVDGVNQLQNIEPMTNVDDPHNVGKKLGGGTIGAGYQNAYGARDRFDNATDQAAGIESDNYNQPVTGSGLDNNNNLRYSDYIYPFDRDATPAEDAVAKAASKVRGYNDSFRAVYPTNTAGNRHKSTPVVTNTTVGTDDAYDTAGLGIVYGQGFDNRTPRFFVPNTVDTSEIDTVQILASLSSADSITASGTQLQLFYWSGDRPGFQSLQNKFAHPSADFPSSNRQYDGWRPIAQKPSGEIDSSVSSNLIDIEKPVGYQVGKVSKFSIQIPEWVRSKATRFMLIQLNANSSRDNLVLYSIGYQRRNALTINTTLEDERESAFVRVGMNSELNSKERRKKLNDMLKASRQYMLKSLGFASLFNDEVKISDVVDSSFDFGSVMQGSGKFGNARFHDIIDHDKKVAAQNRAKRSARARSSATAYKRSFR